MVFSRSLDITALLAKKSFFLFGPRATGKSFLVNQQLLPDVPVFDLLRNDLYLTLSADHGAFGEMLAAYPNAQLMVIDEIQRLPILLNEVHRQIEQRGVTFLLTGSSARKLKQAGVNLLAGRAWQAELFPLATQEIPDFDLQRYLQYGGLPAIYSSADPQEALYAYTHTYLHNEIQAEALVRNLPVFSKFLVLSALSSGNMLNFTAISNEVGVTAATIREYYQILEDTFLGFMVPSWQKSIKRKPVSTAKFYYFDLGVRNALIQNYSIPDKTELFGQAFEHFIAMELRAYISYSRKKLPLQYWQTKHGHEVDFIIGDQVAIEVMSATQVQASHLKSLRMLQQEDICQHYYLVSRDQFARQTEGILCLHWQEFLSRLWAGQILSAVS